MHSKTFSLNRFLMLLCATALAAPAGFADDAPAPSPTTASAAPAAPLNADQVDSLVAPIALYPDSLLSQILVASTYPLEIIQAEQWLEQNNSLQGDALTSAAKQQSWDASVQALVIFPDVLKRLSQDVTWTTNLGNAFLANQGQVMDSVQRLRSRAQDTGKLSSTQQLQVVKTTQDNQPVIEIQPTNPEVVYVPEYNPVWIWGPSSAYYPYPYWDYPPQPVGVWCSWYPGISLSFAFGSGWRGGYGWGWAPHWHDHAVIVNNSFIVNHNFNHGAIAHTGGQAVWHHDVAHRMGVAYPNRAVAARYHPVPRFHPSVPQAQAQFHAAAQRVPMDRIGNRQITPNGYTRYRSTAFGGVGNGAVTRSYSSRGFSSMRSVRSGGRSAGVGHGAAGGGGHAAGGGGGHMGEGGGGHH